MKVLAKERPEDIVRSFPDVYVTKYALSKGILHFKNAHSVDRQECRNGVWSPHDGSSAVHCPHPRGMNGEQSFYNKKDWHTSLDAAQARVREMIQAKRKSINKQLLALAKVEQNGAAVSAMTGVRESEG